MKPLFLLTLVLLLSCGTREPALHGKLKQLDENEIGESYAALLNRIDRTWTKKTLGEIPGCAETYLRDSIFEYWYDTPWDFYGTTQVPRQGKIACGYFVTTTLKHLGLNIDRVYLAQQASAEIIKEVCDPSSVKVFTNMTYKKMITYVKTHKGHIFIAGLDNHVGFIAKEGEEIYFIHASGIAPLKVVKEKCDEAIQLTQSKYHMVGHINFSRWAKSLKNHGS